MVATATPNVVGDGDSVVNAVYQGTSDGRLAPMNPYEMPGVFHAFKSLP